MTGNIGLTYTVEGWKELTVAMRALPNRVKRQTRRRFRKPAEKIRDAAQANARQQGLVDSGDLIESIKVSITGTGVAVKAGTKAVPYPRLHETGGRWPVYPTGDKSTWTWFPAQGTSPARPFFFPAIEDPGGAEIASELASIVRDVGDQLGLDIRTSRFRAPTLLSVL